MALSFIYLSFLGTCEFGSNLLLFLSRSALEAVAFLEKANVKNKQKRATWNSLPYHFGDSKEKAFEIYFYSLVSCK